MRSESTSPASRSTLRWCETVGWERSKSGTSSQTQTLPACLRSTSTSWRRIGSPSALATSAMRSGLGAVDVGVDDGLAARLAGGALGFRGEFHVNAHTFKSIDLVDGRQYSWVGEADGVRGVADPGHQGCDDRRGVGADAAQGVGCERALVLEAEVDQPEVGGRDPRGVPRRSVLIQRAEVMQVAEAGAVAGGQDDRVHRLALTVAPDQLVAVERGEHRADVEQAACQ